MKQRRIPSHTETFLPTIDDAFRETFLPTIDDAFR